MHYLQNLQIFFSGKKTLKLDLTVLFTYLKIILLQYFQFSVFNNKRYPNRPLKRFFIYILAFYFCFFSFYILFFTLCKYVSHNCSLLCFMRLRLGLKGFNLVTLDYISLKIYLLFIFFNYIFF